MLSGRRAQTATEFAILGTLIIVAFSFLINYSEKLNRQQSYIMQAFRAALKTARDANNSASYTKFAFRRMPNVSNPMELGQLQSFSGSANVLWSKGEEPDEYGYYVEKKEVSKYQLNEDAAKDVEDDRTDEDQPTNEITNIGTNNPIESTSSSFGNTINAKRTLVKTENPAGITTNRTLNATDKLQVDINLGYIKNATTGAFEPNPFSATHYLGADGKYYPNATDADGNPTSLERTRDMQ